MPSPQTSPLNLTTNVVIVGGGVIGLSIARALRQRGVFDVTLIERGDLGAEASRAAGGILAPQVEADRPDEFFSLVCASRDLYPGFADALREETEIDVELDKTGTLYLGFTERDELEMRRRYGWQTSTGLRVEWLAGDDARSLEPSLSPQVRCALRFPNDYQVQNRRLVEALIAANQKLGVRLITRCEVDSLRIEKERVSGVETSAGFVSAPIAIVAAGAWASQITPTRVQIEPVRGQMLCFYSQPQVARHVIYSSRGYVVPRHNGRLLAGSTSERVGFDKRVTEDGVKSIRSMALEIAPAVENLPLIDSWAGLRPHAEDDLPVLGADQEVSGLFYATGHYRNGILLAPITAQLVADSILNGGTSPLLEKFSPGRFCRVTV
jgi:glycine oxidase